MDWWKNEIAISFIDLLLIDYFIDYIKKMSTVKRVFKEWACYGCARYYIAPFML